MSTEQKRRRKTHFWLIGICLLIGVVLSVGLVGIWLYSGHATSAKLEVFRATGLPVARVGSEYISADHLARLTSVSAILQKQGYTPHSAIQLEGVAVGKVNVQSRDLSLAEQALSDDQLYREAVSLVGAGVSRSTVLKIFVLEAKLRTWYAAHGNVEPSFAEQVAAAEQSLTAGGSFEQLAKEYSEDAATKWFSGDTGYLNVANLVPEYADEVVKLSVGERRTIYSRYGAHIAELKEKLEQDGAVFVRVQEIVIRPQHFDQWLATEKARVPIVWYVQ